MTFCYLDLEQLSELAVVAKLINDVSLGGSPPAGSDRMVQTPNGGPENPQSLRLARP